MATPLSNIKQTGRYALETTPGTIATSPTWVIVPSDLDSFALESETLTSAGSPPGNLGQAVRQGVNGYNLTGSIGGPLYYGNWDPFFESNASNSFIDTLGAGRTDLSGGTIANGSVGDTSITFTGHTGDPAYGYEGSVGNNNFVLLPGGSGGTWDIDPPLTEAISGGATTKLLLASPVMLIPNASAP